MATITHIALFAVITVSFMLPSQAMFGQDDLASDNLTQRDLVILHSKAKLDLAEVELQKAKEMNEGAETIPPLVVERLKSNLAIAREHFRHTMKASTGGPKQVRVRHAEEKVRLAKIDFEAGKKLRASGAISALELRRLELTHDLAKLNVAMLKKPGSFVTLIDSMQRQLDRFGEEIVSLDQRITKLETNR
jgi:multidrug resistance efflux pump